MTLLKIKALLVEQGIKLNEIARRAGVDRVTVSIVITGRGKSRRIQKTIARALKMKYKDLWEQAA